MPGPLPSLQPVHWQPQRWPLHKGKGLSPLVHLLGSCWVGLVPGLQLG